jgi:hypothetical protein
MKKLIFESNLLSDGHLYCPEELAHKKNAHFKVVVTFEETDREASEYEIEQSNINDVSEDFLSDEELNYYLNLEPYEQVSTGADMVG